MGRVLVLLLVAAGVAAVPAEAPDSEAPGPEAPDGLLVMGVVGRGDASGTVHGERAVVSDPRTGETRARGLPGGTLCHGPVMAVADRVVFSGNRGRRAAALSLPLTLTGPARSLGAADTIAPSATPGRLWLGRWRRPRGMVLREVDGEGVTLARDRIPASRWTTVQAALDDGFVVGHGRWLTLRERQSERQLRNIRDGWLVAARGSRLAWCGPRCRILRLREPAGERTLRPPSGAIPQGGHGAFSPDGDRLALTLLERGRPRAAVIDLASGDWSVVPGGSPSVYAAMAWSPSGRWLYFAAGRHRLAAWQPGAERAMRLPVELDGTVMSIATSG